MSLNILLASTSLEFHLILNLPLDKIISHRVRLENSQVQLSVYCYVFLEAKF